MRFGWREKRRMMKTVMTVRESVHQLVDALPEERLQDALNILEQLEDDDSLTPEEEAAIEEGLEDLRQGRTMTLEEYERSRGL